MYSTQYPAELQELQRELMTGYHKELIRQMNRLGFTDMSDGLVHMATHCGILLEGIYTFDEKLKLCSQIAQALVEKREKIESTIILNSSGLP